MLAGVVGLSLVAGCGSAGSVGGGNVGLNPVTAQPQAPSSPSLAVNGSFAEGKVYMDLETGDGPEVDGTGVIARGPGTAQADLQPVAVRGTRIGSELCLQLFADDASPNSEPMMIAGTIGGEASLWQPGQAREGVPLTLTIPQKDSVSPRWLEGPFPEHYRVQAQFRDNDELLRRAIIDVTLNTNVNNVKSGSFTTTVPFGPIKEESSGTAEVFRYQESDVWNIYLYTSHGGAARFCFYGPRNTAQEQVQLDDSSFVVVSTKSPDKYSIGLPSMLQNATLEAL